MDNPLPPIPYQYQVGGSLEYQHPTYVVRQADFELYEGLKNGEFCYVLNSRQMGKSSLRVQMMKKLKEQGIKCASIDMTRIGSHVTPSEWYAGVISELLRGFGLSRKVNFSTWWREREFLPPLQRLRELIEDVLLAEFSQKLVIFIDEIDSIINIKFKEDFFAFIRACYNQRVDNPEYNRLTFCLLGVATPSDLITDKNISTPFNIGRAIELTGFQLHEATPLAQGLVDKTSNSQAVLSEVLAWTGGQPFLTQKVCKLILSAESATLASPQSSELIPEENEAAWVENLVQSQIIENWETQDEPEHLRTIRDRILWSGRNQQLLKLYQQILQAGEVKALDKPEYMELRLSSLVVKQQGKLRVYNRIYASVFNKNWVDEALAELGLEDKVAGTATPSQAEIQALEQTASDALQQFEFQELEALILAMQAGQALKTLVNKNYPLQDYPTVMPIYALQTILDNIRELNQFQFHINGINSVSFSPDGQCFATAGADSSIRIWNLQGHQLAQLEGHQSWVRRVIFSPDGQRLATTGYDDPVRIWNLDGQQIVLNGHQGRVNNLSFSPDGQRLATAGYDGTVRLWNLDGQQLSQLKDHQGSFAAVSFSPDGQHIAIAGAGGKVKLWHPEEQQLLDFKGHLGWVYSLSFSGDGQCLATGGTGGTVQLWDLSGNELAQWQSHKGLVYCVSFHPKEQQIATTGADGMARLWDLSGRQLAQWQSPNNSVYSSVSFSPDGQLLATAGTGGLQIWQIGGLDELLSKGCDWLKDYLLTHPQELEKLEVCQNKFSSVEVDRNLSEAGQVEDAIHASKSSAPIVPNTLKSECGIDYDRLRDLLSAEQWQEADLETTAIMLRISNREAQRWLREEDIENFSCIDLLTIDQLWVKYSKGRFGFSVQKEIWESVGGSKNADYETYCLACKRLGWGKSLGWKEFGWLSYSNLTFNITAPIGHLPGGLLNWLWSSYRESLLSSLNESANGTALHRWWNIFSSLTLRLEECNKSSVAVKTVARQRLVTQVSIESGEGFLGEFFIHDKLVSIYYGDITNLVTDVIVSSDDNHLTMGGGVSARIRQIGGDEIYREGQNLTPLSLGEVGITKAGKLLAKKVFHSVVIDYEDKAIPSIETLQKVVHTCIKKANICRFRSIAFPLLGTGAGGFPLQICWEILVQQIIKDLSNGNQNIVEVIVVLHESRIVEELDIKSFLKSIKNLN